MPAAGGEGGGGNCAGQEEPSEDESYLGLDGGGSGTAPVRSDEVGTDPGTINATGLHQKQTKRREDQTHGRASFAGGEKL